MKKRIAFSLLGLIVIIGSLVGVKALQIKDLIAAGESMSPPPTAITAIDVQNTDWETTLSSIGTLEAAQGVVITADLTGRVARLYFDGGETGIRWRCTAGAGDQYRRCAARCSRVRSGAGAKQSG